MSFPTFADLKHAEVFLRRDDKALRLRVSTDRPDWILVERKTFRGRIGKRLVIGGMFLPDAGIRAELGHVLVAQLPADSFDVRALRESLHAADTWKRGEPLWASLERQETQEKARKKLARQDAIRYRTSELFDKYVWTYKQRVTVPEQIT